MDTAETLEGHATEIRHTPQDHLQETREKLIADTFTAYADGSSLGNPGPGGWAVIITGSGERRVVIGSAKVASNNQMELTAATNALTSLPLDAVGVIHCDSEYVVKGLNDWLPGWKRRGWYTSKGKPVANAEYWRTLEALAKQRPGVRFAWVRGHAGNPENELVDTLARAEAEKVRAGLPAVSRLELSE